MREMPTVPYGTMERKKDGKYEWLRDMWNSIIFLMGIQKEKIEWRRSNIQRGNKWEFYRT